MGYREQQVLDLWERGVGLDRWRRDDALLSVDAPAPRRLGARNAALLSLRNTHFQDPWSMTCNCPGCGGAVEFLADSVSLAESLAGLKSKEKASLHWRGTEVLARPATVDDLRAAGSAGDIDGVARAVLERCLSGDIDLAAAEGAALDELGRQLEALDPAAIVTFDLTCPDCANSWPALIDIAETLWSEVRNRAERLFLDVDALARVYGWTEDQVLSLSPTRRAAYLQLAEAS